MPSKSELKRDVRRGLYNPLPNAQTPIKKKKCTTCEFKGLKSIFKVWVADAVDKHNDSHNLQHEKVRKANVALGKLRAEPIVTFKATNKISAQDALRKVDIAVLNVDNSTLKNALKASGIPTKVDKIMFANLMCHSKVHK